MSDKPQTPNDASDNVKSPLGQSVDETRAHIAKQVNAELAQRPTPKENRP
jgi:hypothetical protein